MSLNAIEPFMVNLPSSQNNSPINYTSEFYDNRKEETSHNESTKQDHARYLMVQLSSYEGLKSQLAVKLKDTYQDEQSKVFTQDKLEDITSSISSLQTQLFQVQNA